MTLTLLLDLDDTLLSNAIGSFLPAYINKLAGFMSDMFPPETFVSAVMSGTHQMVQNQNPDCTLEQVFDSVFYPALGVSKQDLAEKITRFYADIFPSLRYLTKPRREAIEIVEEALKRDYTICIATNPLFPREAIIQRIQWAGLAPEKFKLVTSYESFHFAKPNPAYYAEILSHLAWPENPVIMVGDNAINDIQGARKADLSTFWINEQSRNLDDPKTGEGKLEDLFPWIDRFNGDLHAPDYHSPDACEATLLATPAVLDGALENLPKSAWKYKPAPDEWSLTEIVCHLRDVDQEVNAPRLEAILLENNPFITGVDSDPWANERNYILQDGHLALQRFINARTRLVEWIKNIQPDQWNRPARHSIFGPTDFLEVAWLITRHDRMHVAQVLQTLAAVPTENRIY
jgi:HAD superfamily hydrolase (TIGR01549 family)